MKQVSRADLLKTLVAVADQPDQASLPQALATCLGFRYEESKASQHQDPKQWQPNIGDKTQDNQSQPLPVGFGQATPKNRYWYIARQESIPVETEADTTVLTIDPTLKEKPTQPLAHRSLKTQGEWLNVLDATLKQAQASKQLQLQKSIKHLAQNKPAENLPKRERCRFSEKVCIIMERTEALRPLWGDMREIWQLAEKLIGTQQLFGYSLPAGVCGHFKPLNKITPSSLNDLPTATVLIYIGTFGALHTGKHSPAWQAHLEAQQRYYSCHLYTACPLAQSPAHSVHELDAQRAQDTALNALQQALSLQWLLDEKQLRLLRIATPDSSLHTELLCFNHPETAYDSHYLWSKNTAKTRLSPKIYQAVKQAQQQWSGSVSAIVNELQQLLLQLSEQPNKPPQQAQFRYLQNLAAKTSHNQQTGQFNQLSSVAFRSAMPQWEQLAQLPATKDWGAALQVAQNEAIRRESALPLGAQGLVSDSADVLLIRQQNNYLHCLPMGYQQQAWQGLLTLGNHAYCEESNRLVSAGLPSTPSLHIRDFGTRYQLRQCRKPRWAERIWQNNDGLFAAHEDGTVLQMQAGQWQAKHNAWGWAGDVGVDDYGLWAELLLKKSGKTLTTFKMRWIPAGEFLMGSPESEKNRKDDETQHKVRISRGFWLAETSCTQQQWQAVMGENPSLEKGEQLPVNRVNWEDGQRWVEKIKEYTIHFQPKLPSEAQWEYACRAGKTTAYWWGDEFDEAKGNNSNQLWEEIKSPPNPNGLRSMSGNIFEWCQDSPRNYPKNSNKIIVDPLGPESDSQRVLRGGSWFYGTLSWRSAYRDAYSPDNRNVGIGLRLAGGFDPQASGSSLALTADRLAQQKPSRAE